MALPLALMFLLLPLLTHLLPLSRPRALSTALPATSPVAKPSLTLWLRATCSTLLPSNRWSLHLPALFWLVLVRPMVHLASSTASTARKVASVAASLVVVVSLVTRLRHLQLTLQPRRLACLTMAAHRLRALRPPPQPRRLWLLRSCRKTTAPLPPSGRAKALALGRAPLTRSESAGSCVRTQTQPAPTAKDAWRASRIPTTRLTWLLMACALLTHLPTADAMPTGTTPSPPAATATVVCASLAAAAVAASRPRRNSPILLSPVEAQDAVALHHIRTGATTINIPYPAALLDACIARCTFPGCPLTIQGSTVTNAKANWTKHQRHHVAVSCLTGSRRAALAIPHTITGLYRPALPDNPPPVRPVLPADAALTPAQQLHFLAQLDVAALTRLGSVNLIIHIPASAQPGMQMAFTQALRMATNEDTRCAGLNLLALLPGFCLSHSTRGGGANNIGRSRHLTNMHTNIAMVNAGDYVCAHMLLEDRQAALAARDPPTPRPEAAHPPAHPGQLTEREVKRLLSKIHQGNYRGAADALQPSRAPEMDEHNQTTLRNQFPRRDTPLDVAALTALLPGCPTITISSADVKAALGRCRPVSPGLTGLAIGHVKAMIGGMKDPDEVSLDLIAKLATQYANGTFIGCPAAEWLKAAVVTPLIKRKGDGTYKKTADGHDDLRAILTCETITSLMDRCVFNEKLITHIRGVFEPLGQVGIGTPLGAQIVSMVMHAIARVGEPIYANNPLAHTVLQSDLASAFQSFDVELGLRMVRKYTPQLYPLMLFRYGGTRRVEFGSRRAGPSRRFTLDSEKGDQGGVFSTFLFCHAMIPAIRAAAAQAASSKVVLLHYVDDSHAGSFTASSIQVDNAFDHLSGQLETTMGCTQNKAKCFAINAHTDVTGNLLTTRCTPLPPSSGIVSLGCPIGHHETFMPGEVMDRLRPVISSMLVLAHVAKRHPAEAQRLTAISLARKADYLMEVVPPHLCADAFRAYDKAYSDLIKAIFGTDPGPQIFWPKKDGGLGMPRPTLQRRAAAYVRAAYAREAVLKKVNFETYSYVCLHPNSTHNLDLRRARAALHPEHGHYLPLDSPAEQPSNIEIARNTAPGAVTECNNILMEEEKNAMSPQVLSIIAGNTSASCAETAYSWWSAPLAPHSARWSADAWRAAMSATLGYCPPGLESLATDDDPIMRKSLSHKSYGTSIKRHNNVVREEHAIERQASWVSATEVSGLYPDGRRPDTAGITPQGVFRMTDVKVTDPHTAARLNNGATVQSVIISAASDAFKPGRRSGYLAMPLSTIFIHPVDST